METVITVEAEPEIQLGGGSAMTEHQQIFQAALWGSSNQTGSVCFLPADGDAKPEQLGFGKQ